MRVETLVLADSAWAKFAQYGAKFSELYSAALRDAGMLCLAIYRRIEDTDAEEATETEDTGDEATEKVSSERVKLYPGPGIPLSRHFKVGLGKTQGLDREVLFVFSTMSNIRIK